MKTTLLLIFTFIIITLHAQKQYKCYHVQEFLWNSKTSQHDIAIEKGEDCIFKVDVQEKKLVQSFKDGTSSNIIINSESYNKNNDVLTYETLSPANGFVYLYKINESAQIIEVIIKKNNQETLLKKYLYK